MEKEDEKTSPSEIFEANEDNEIECNSSAKEKILMIGNNLLRKRGK